MIVCGFWWHSLVPWHGRRAWNIIKEHSLVTVTIDVFQWELFSLGENNRKNILLSEFNQKMTAISDCHFNHLNSAYCFAFAFLLIWHPFYLRCVHRYFNFKPAIFLLSSDDKPSFSLLYFFYYQELHTLIYFIPILTWISIFYPEQYLQIDHKPLKC
jgi:hypothetical protein